MIDDNVILEWSDSFGFERDPCPCIAGHFPALYERDVKPLGAGARIPDRSGNPGLTPFRWEASEQQSERALAQAARGRATMRKRWDLWRKEREAAKAAAE